ncbi:class I SAM-dependent methyltransferase [bacterium]|nr:class I SAM-dependent methyltransferase [bacterium]
MDIQKEIEFFDRFEAEHHDYDVLGEAAYARFLTFFQEWLSPRPGQRCVDLGCGSGAFTRRLRPFQLELTGVDISPRLVASATTQSAGEGYLVGDITNTSLPEKSVDFVVYSGVLHHFPTSADRLAVLREGYRLLAPGGSLFAYDPHLFSPSMFLYRDPRSPFFSSAGKTENEVLLSSSMMRSELAQVGFVQPRFRPVSGTPFRFVEGKLARRILPLYNLYEWMMRYSGLERWLGTFLLMCARRPPDAGGFSSAAAEAASP